MTPLLLLAVLLVAGVSQAQSTSREPRYWYDQHGNFVIIGNTLAQGCNTETPAPLLGAIGSPCGSGKHDDTSPDYFWTVGDRADGTAARADSSLAPLAARSQARLVLPPGAKVTYARLYWAATRSNSVKPPPVDRTPDQPDTTAELSFRTGPLGRLETRSLTADVTFTQQSSADADFQYQSSLEVTRLVQEYGPGLYQVGGVDAIDLRNTYAEFMFSSWWMVVFYELESEPMRHLKLYDGLDIVAGNDVNLQLKGFYVPEWATAAELGIVAFDGDDPDVGDWFEFNKVKMRNALNPADNFFNSTRSAQRRGAEAAAVSHEGDVPQLKGTPWSMSGLDMDVVDVTMAPGDTSASVRVGTAGDIFWLGGFVASISTQRPDFRATYKTVENLSRTDGTTRPGDRLRYTITTTNKGDDASRDTKLVDRLSALLEYVPHSLVVNGRPMTDRTGDDAAWWDGTRSTLTVHLGKGATPERGGEMAIGDSATVSFEVRIAASAQGTIENQAIIIAGGKLGADSMETYSRPAPNRPSGPTSVPVGIPRVPTLETPANGSVIPDRSPTYSGSAEPGHTVIVKREDGSVVCTATADSVTGAWSCPEPTRLANGPHTVTVVAESPSGRQSAPVSSTFTVTDSSDAGDGGTGPSDGGTGPGVDELLIVGRGCSSSGGSPLAWLAALLLALPLMCSRRSGTSTRRSSAAAGLVALGMLSAPVARAQAIDVQRYKPGPGATDILAVHGARVGRHLDWHLGASLNYASNPLGLLDPQQDDFVYQVVATQVTLDLMGSISLFDRFELGMAVPFTYQASERGAVHPALSERVSGGGMGDLRLVPKAHLLSTGRLHLGLAVPVVLPTAGGQGFRGGMGVAVRPQVVGEWASEQGVRVVANLGASLRGETRLRNLRAGHELSYALGARVPFGERFAVQAQLAGALGLAEQDAEELPLELLASVQYRLREGLLAHVGGGPGLTRGYGTPGFRLFAGIDWTQPGERAPAPPSAPTDADGDRIPDARDACPAAAEDLDGFRDEDGCPDEDNDEDRIPDTQDACPSQPETGNGFQDEDGCPDGVPPSDTDDDGVTDGHDRCVSVPEDKDGFEDADGCPDLDDDHDGVQDAQDQCRMQPEVINGVKDEDGCPDEGKPQVIVDARVGRLLILEKVHFATASHEILERSHGLLRQVALVLKAHPRIELLRVEGHTDDRGNDASNLGLSQRRADSVRSFLIREGIAPERLTAVGYGETMPLESNQTEAGRESNRRVEFNIVKLAGALNEDLGE